MDPGSVLSVESFSPGREAAVSLGICRRNGQPGDGQDYPFLGSPGKSRSQHSLRTGTFLKRWDWEGALRFQFKEKL